MIEELLQTSCGLLADRSQGVDFLRSTGFQENTRPCASKTHGQTDARTPQRDVLSLFSLVAVQFSYVSRQSYQCLPNFVECYNSPVSKEEGRKTV